jgi:hypothetical protein
MSIDGEEINLRRITDIDQKNVIGKTDTKE